MKPGEVFNPYKRFRGAWIPEALLRNTAVTRGAAVLYGQLARYAGQDGRCFPRQDRLAVDLGVTVRTVQRYLRDLVRLALIRPTPRGLGRSQVYDFLWNSLLETRQMNLFDTTELSPAGATDVSCLSLLESQKNESTTVVNQRPRSGPEQKPAVVAITSSPAFHPEAEPPAPAETADPAAGRPVSHGTGTKIPETKRLGQDQTETGLSGVAADCLSVRTLPASERSQRAEIEEMLAHGVAALRFDRKPSPIRPEAEENNGRAAHA